MKFGLQMKKKRVGLNAMKKNFFGDTIVLVQLR